MSLILAIETATQVCGAALVKEGLALGGGQRVLMIGIRPNAPKPCFME